MIKIIEQILFIGFLFVTSWQDLRSKSVAVWVYGIFGSAACFLSLCRSERMSWEAVLCGIAIGAFLLLLSRLTEGAIGEGDGYFFIVAGMFLGVWRTIILFFGGVMLCGCCCMGILLWGIGNRVSVKKKTIPFLPFLMPLGICLAVM